MPYLDLGDWKNGLDAFAPVRVFATMLFPTDDQRRTEYLALTFKQARLAPASPSEKPPPLYRALETARKVYLTEGKPGRGGYLAGEILAIVWNIAEHHEGSPRGEASVSKAKELLVEAKKSGKRFPGGLIASNSETLRKAWSNFQSVSHLWFAASCWIPGEAVLEKSETALPDAVNKALTSENFPAILAVAEDIRRFGEAHTTRAREGGKPKPTLSPKETWKLPDGFPLPSKDFSAGLKPFSGSLTKWFQENRARVRY